MEKNLHQLVGDYMPIIEAIYKDLEEGGENQDHLLKEFQDIDLAVATKIDGYAIVLDRLKMESELWKERAKQYSAIAKACINASERLKFTIKSTMDFMDTNEVLGVERRFKLANCAPKLIIEDENRIPDDYKKEIVVVEIDKAKLKSDLQVNPNLKIPGAFLEYNKSIRQYANKPKTLKKKTSKKLKKGTDNE